MFRYNYDPSFPDHEEPEDLTFWDLTDRRRALNIDGELHVLLLDNNADTFVIDDDDVYIMHYTKGIYVKKTYSGISTGDRETPDKTVKDAVERAFEDMEIRIWNGSYPERLTITKRVRLVADSGFVRIG